MPIIEGREGLSELATPDFFQVPYPSRGSTERVVALMYYNCVWDVEHAHSPARICPKPGGAL